MPKNPSPAQQAASKANGRKSLGPKTVEAKQRSSQNARTTGLFAKTLALPHELGAWADRSEHWHSYYGPQSPATIHLTNECARATLLADRSADYRQSQLDLQVENETQDWHHKRKRKVDRLAKEVNGRPEYAVARLMTFGAGVSWLARCFGETLESANPGLFDAGLAPDDDQVVRRFPDAGADHSGPHGLHGQSLQPGLHAGSVVRRHRGLAQRGKPT